MAIEQLLQRMTLEEKAGQLSLYVDPVRTGGTHINPENTDWPAGKFEAEIAAGRVTGVFNGIGVAKGRELQRAAVEQSRCGIPLLFGADVVHGLKTVFPVPLAEASSFDPELAQRTARAAAVEATAMGLNWVFAPVVDIARDQRWGRVVEASGEDVWLSSRFAEARVRGFQNGDLSAEDSVLACPKHFAGYGAVSGGMEYNSSEMAETTLRETHLPPFQAAFAAGALSTMASLHDINGIPATGNHHLLTDILRGDFAFRGLVVSDYLSDRELMVHGFASDEADAAAKALMAGCDISMQSGIYIRHLPDLVKSGRVPISTVDEAVRRVLYVKKQLGLFDNPYRSLDARREVADIHRPETHALARESARKSVVLLKNDGDLLPLPKAGKAIALIGPSVADRADLPGPWANHADIPAGVTIEDGFRAALGKGARLSVTPGCGYEAPIEGGIAAAVAAARGADIVVLVVGEHRRMSGEAQARVDITIPAPQLALAEAIAATGKPMVVLLRHGRALALGGAVAAAPAIMACWFLGTQTGHAIADVLFGDHAPQGRLPVSFPYFTGQEPWFYNHRATGRAQLTSDPKWTARYREAPNGARYPFGHGLSYSSVSYGVTTVDMERWSGDRPLIVSAAVTNIGKRAMHEVAQLYIHQRVASITQPVRVLKGVAHLDIAPGQTRTVSFPLDRDALGFVHEDLRRLVEPGTFDVWVAPSSIGGSAASFVLI